MIPRISGARAQHTGRTSSVTHSPGILPCWLILPIALLLLAATPAPLSVGSADPARFLDDIKALTVPAMEGRGDGTPGLAIATHLIEARYKELGLDPAGTQGYLQPFPMVTGAKIVGTPSLVKIEQGISQTPLKLNADYVPFSFSASGTLTGPLVFVGYGITAAEYSYDDYAGVDVKGKTVVILRGESPVFTSHLGTNASTRHANIVTKAINARDHGAAAAILINGKLAPGEEDLLAAFGSITGPEDVGIPIMQVTNEAAASWFIGSGKSLADVQARIDASDKPDSMPFAASQTIALDLQIETTRATVNNVLAYLPGKTDEYIIIGAHYDHLGYGNYDSLAPSQIGQIHPGADDNASGTAGVLELARLFAPLKGQLPRGILFMSFAGEELGLLGSAEWVKEPTRPLDKAVAMLNMDMIGRIHDDKVYIGGVGTGSTFTDRFSPACAEKFAISRLNIRRAATRRAITRRSSRKKFRCSSFSPGCIRIITSLPTPGTRSTPPMQREAARSCGRYVAAARYGRRAARVRNGGGDEHPGAAVPAEVAATDRTSARFRISAK